ITENSANPAASCRGVPSFGSLGKALSVPPYGVLVAAGGAAACAFTRPVATPASAVGFGSGDLAINHMRKAGRSLNTFGIILVVLAVYVLFPVVWGIDLNTLPDAFKN